MPSQIGRGEPRLPASLPLCCVPAKSAKYGLRRCLIAGFLFLVVMIFTNLIDPPCSNRRKLTNYQSLSSYRNIFIHISFFIHLRSLTELLNDIFYSFIYVHIYCINFLHPLNIFGNQWNTYIIIILIEQVTFPD